MFKSAEVILGAALLILLAGCASNPSDQNGPAPSDVTLTNVVVTGPTNPVPKTISKPATNSPAVTNPAPLLHANLPVPAIAPPAPILTWTSLNRWAAKQILPTPRLVSKSPVTTYSLNSPHGTLTLVIGSRDILWDGVEIHLAFAPEIIDNEIFVYGLDLQKTLEPLLLKEPRELGTNRVIVIDPGHGGINGGTICVLDQRPEKEFTLDVARRIKPLLEAKGWHVYLTRTNDVDVTLSNRVAFAEFHHADIFVSLHFNSSAPDHRQSGLETYCMTPAGLPSTLTRGNPDPLWQMFPNNKFDAGNLQLAARLHTAALRATGEEDRGVRRARFMGVLQGQKRPAILIEGGYLSNPHEAARIESEVFRQRLAEGLAHALSELEPQP